MKVNQDSHSVATMCRMLGVSPSGYYAWRDREPSARAKSDEALKVRIQAIHDHCRGTYGAPRIHAELVAEDRSVSRKRVARLMRELGLVGVSRRKGTRTTRRDDAARAAPDLVESFFATLECELIDRSTFKTQAEARMAIFEFIEGWFNPHRRHSALGYLSPNAFERAALEAETGDPQGTQGKGRGEIVAPGRLWKPHPGAVPPQSPSASP